MSSESMEGENNQDIIIQNSENENCVIERNDSNTVDESQPSTSQVSCVSKKRRDSTDPQNSKRVKLDEEAEDGDDGRLCPICFDNWTTSGDHRLCSLHCGHLFGYQCVERWISINQTCPTCKQSAKKTSIRFIFAKKVIAMDTSELYVLKQELNEFKIENGKLHHKLAISNERICQQTQEIYRLSKLVENIKTENSTCPNTVIQKKYSVYRQNHITLSAHANSRVMAFYPDSALLALSCMSPNPIFRGYGVRQISTKTLKTLSFMHLHRDTIRDLAFHPRKELLLSASTDKTVKISDPNLNKAIQVIECEQEVWCCTWDFLDPHYIYFGDQRGSAWKYDIRRADREIYKYDFGDEYSGVVALSSYEPQPRNNSPSRGVIICKLRSLNYFENNSQNKKTLLSADGPFISMQYNREKDHLLLNARPNRENTCMRYCIKTLDKEPDDDLIRCNTVETFYGGPSGNRMTRSCQMNIGDDILIPTYHERHKCIEIWSLSSRTKIAAPSVHKPIVDILPITINHNPHFTALSEERVDLFRVERQ